MAELIRSEQSYAILGACFTVYNNMGCGFLESVYQVCLHLEFQMREIPFVAQPELRLRYRGRELQHVYRPDFLCFGGIIVELKAVSRLAAEHRSQVLNYLSASGNRLGLLVNFGHYPRLEFERIICFDRSPPNHLCHPGHPLASSPSSSVSSSFPTLASSPDPDAAL